MEATVIKSGNSLRALGLQASEPPRGGAGSLPAESGLDTSAMKEKPRKRQGEGKRNMGIGNALGRAGRAALCLALAVGLAPAVAVTAGTGIAEATEIEVGGTTWSYYPVKSVVDRDTGEEGYTGISVVFEGTDSEEATVPDTVMWGSEELPVVAVNGFGGNESIKAVHLSPNVTSILAGAFKGCASLERVTGAGGVKYLYASAFEGCSSLAETDLDPETVEQILPNAFKDCPYVFDDPYLTETWEGARGLAATASFKTYAWSQIELKAVDYLNELRRKKGLSEVKADLNLTLYARERAIQSALLGQSHSQRNFVKRVDALDSSGYKHSCSEDIGANMLQGDDPRKLGAEAVAKMIVDDCMSDVSHMLPLMNENTSHVGIGFVYIPDSPFESGGAVEIADCGEECKFKHADLTKNSIEAVTDETTEIEYLLATERDGYEHPYMRIQDTRNEDIREKTWNKVDYTAKVWFTLGMDVEWKCSNESVASIKPHGSTCEVKLLKPGSYTLTCTIPTSNGKSITLSQDYVSEKEVYTPVTYTDKNGTVYTQIENGKRTLAATGLTAAAKTRKTASVALPSGVTIDGRKWTVKAIAKGFLKGSAATKLKVYDPYVSVAKGVLKGTKVKTVRLAHAKGWHYKENFGPDAAKRIRKAELKELKQSFAKKRCGKKVKVTACKR